MLHAQVGQWLDRASPEALLAEPSQVFFAYPRQLGELEHPIEESALPGFLQHIARYLPEAGLDALIAQTRARSGNDLDAEGARFLALLKGLEQRGAGASARAWVTPRQATIFSKRDWA